MGLQRHGQEEAGEEVRAAIAAGVGREGEDVEEGQIHLFPSKLTAR